MEANISGYLVNLRTVLRCGAFSDILEVTSQGHENVVSKRIWSNRRDFRKDLKELSDVKNHLLTLVRQVPDHENIIKPYDIENDENAALYIFMERATEFDIQEFVYKVGYQLFIVSYALNFMVEIADAVDCLHRNGIVHKNIKPENVLVTKSQEGNFVTKLSDFAERHYLSAHENLRPGQSSSSRAKLPDEFMPPEYWTNDYESAFTKEGDYFATGLMCSAMIQLDDDNILQPKIESMKGERYAPIGKLMKDRLMEGQKDIVIAVEKEGDHNDKNMLKRIVNAACVYQPQLRISAAQIRDNLCSVDKNQSINLAKAIGNGIAIDLRVTPRIVVPIDEGTRKYYTVFTDAAFYLGGGHFGEVYKALGSDGKYVAAKKFIRREHLAQEEKLKMEACKHKNIVQVFHFGKSESNWIFLELCSFDLKGYFYKYPERYENMEQKFDMMAQTACAISYLHDEKIDIMHRDIKPGNLLVKNDPLPNERALIKVSDFGLAKGRDESGILTGANTANVGTPYFMAPEHFNKLKNDKDHLVHGNPPEIRYYGRPADVFSLGLSFASMIRPYYDYLMPRIHGRESENLRIGEEMFRHRHENPDDKIRIAVDVDGDDNVTQKIKDLIRKATKFSPKQRISAEKLYAEMLTFIGKTREAFEGDN